MQGIVCDRCGEGLLLDGDVRYQMKVEIVAAYDPLEITQEDLEQDFEAEFEKILEQLKSEDPEELQRQVHYQAAFDLCGHCQRSILKDPLFRKRSP